VFSSPFSFVPVDDMEQYLHYIGGGAGALALTGVAAASAFYLASRPSSQKPLFPLDEQCLVEPVSFSVIFFIWCNGAPPDRGRIYEITATKVTSLIVRLAVLERAEL
jgi:hypothetical protein